MDWVLGPARPGGPPEQGEADSIVAHPLDGLLVLEAKGGELAYDPGTRRWTQAGHGGRHLLDEDPFHQARDEMHSLLEILRAQSGWNRWQPSYGYGVAFPDSRYGADAHPGAPASVAIDHGDMERLAERVREIMRRWRHPGRRFGAEGMEALEQALGFRVEMRLPLQLQFQEEDRKIFELTDEQAYVLAYVKKRRRAAVVGPAGSGKTVLATQLARAIATGRTETLLTCFNWRMATYLRESLAGTPHLEVAHFHDLCRRLAQRAELEVPPEPAPDAVESPLLRRGAAPSPW